MVMSSKEYKKAAGGKYGQYRKLEMKEGVWNYIWIPVDAFLYHRNHFNVKKFTSFKNSKYNVVDCCNQKFGANGDGCPICKEIQEDWKRWAVAKKENNKELMKEIQGKINQMVAQEYLVNGIDINDPEKKFVAVRFTQGKFEEIQKVLENQEIGNVLWRYKLSKNGQKTEYTLVDDPINDAVKKLQDELADLTNRPYEHGGPVDLDNCVIRPLTKEQMLEILNGGEPDNDESHAPPSKNSPIMKEREKQQTTVEVTDEIIDLNDEDGDEILSEPEKKETKKEEKVSAKKKDEIEEEVYDLEDLELEVGSTVADPTPPFKLSAELFQKKLVEKDMKFLKKLIEYLMFKEQIKKMATTMDYVNAIKALIKNAGGTLELEAEWELAVPF